MVEFLKKQLRAIASINAVLILFFFTSCNLFENGFVNKLIFEKNVYVRGTTSDSGYINLLENQDYLNQKNSSSNISGILAQYRVTRNATLTDIAVNLYFGENQANVFLGSAYIEKGEIHSEFQNLKIESSWPQLVALIMRNDGFWYSAKGNSPNADVDIEPIRITIYGTFENK
jgi:hypothetical protein